MSLRCLIGWHDIFLTGVTWHGFYKHGRCNRCGAEFVRPPQQAFWSELPDQRQGKKND